MENSCCTANQTSRLLNLGAVPTRTEIANIEFDITLDCNLRCRYCYKGAASKISMPRRVAFDAVIWLIHASGTQKNLGIFFLGGEPLMNWPLIKELIPFGVTRAYQHGKNLTFGMTTNCTLVTDEIVDFFRQWKATFHTSFDGLPEIQNKNRPTASGGPSSHLVEKGVKKILAYQPGVAARCTYDAENAHLLFENYKYFRSLGYTNIILIPALSAIWNEEVLEELEANYMKIAKYWLDEARKGIFIFFKHFEDYFSNRKKDKRGTIPCGSGRGYGVINANGDYFPCSRWGIHSKEMWSFGNIYEGFYESKREEFLRGFQEKDFFPECVSCEAKCICSGGCLAENLDTVGSPFTVIPIGCKIMKIWVKVGAYVFDTMIEDKNAEFIRRYCPEKLENFSKNEPANLSTDQNTTIKESTADYGQPQC